jgi:hypothetical protein
MRRRPTWAILYFRRGLTAVSLPPPAGLDVGAAIANEAADTVAPRALTTMTPAVEGVDGHPEHRREIGNRH